MRPRRKLLLLAIATGSFAALLFVRRDNELAAGRRSIPDPLLSATPGRSRSATANNSKTSTDAAPSAAAPEHPAISQAPPLLAEQIDAIVTAYFEELSKGRWTSGFDPYLRSQPDALIPLLSRYASHPDRIVRHRALTLLAHAAHASPSRSARGEVADLLVAAINDADPLVSSKAFRDLYLLEPNDFSGGAKDQISRALASERTGFEVAKLAGYVHLDEATERLRQLAERPAPSGLEGGHRYFHSVQWAAMLSLARLGDEQAIGTVVARVREEQDVVQRVVTLLDDVGFTQQPQGYELIAVYLTSDETLPPVEGGLRVLYAQHAVHVLARWLPTFPVERKPSPQSYGPSDVETARTWMSQHLGSYRTDFPTRERTHG